MTFRATPPELYGDLGLGSVVQSGSSGEKALRVLYLDMVKRAVCNLIYEDISLWTYDGDRRFLPMNRFDLKTRIEGEDMPTQAHTMVGWKRLSHLENAAAEVIQKNIPGDFVETGVLRGGASIFMRAVLKAYGVTDRRVFACDTFVDPAPQKKEPPQWLKRLVHGILSLATLIPSPKWKLGLYRFLEKHQKSFPISANPSPEWVRMTLDLVRYFYKNPNLLAPKDRVSLEAVRSHFARYGLLDSQVVFLKGFFSDTLPKAEIKAVSLLRLDGDSYESTRSVLDLLYPKVSPGGYVIIDDYFSFTDCSTAVEDYRREHGITEPLVRIDNAGAFWKRSDF